MNASPHPFDLSNIYGYTYKDSLQHRSFKGGELNNDMQRNNDVLLNNLHTGKMSTGVDILGHPILVGAEGNYDPLTIQQCNQPPQYPEFHCFNSGDGNRVSQHPALTALQILMTRRHNQHAEILSKVNPHWDDEKLYLETRRILIAESQHITYSQYIPSLLSDDLLHYFNLLPLKKGFTKYEPHTDVSTIQEFVTSAGRFGHSQINNRFHVKNDPPMDSFTYLMRDVFFDMTLIYLGQTDGIIRGLISELAFAVDPYFVTDVKDYMYQHRNRTSGLDLMGLNIMRGRDHGIPGYVHYLDYCFGYKVTSWGDLHKYIPAKQMSLLQSVYK
ncbi:Heme peroxidase-like protein [Leptotrombidium deliense]|uniref:Heme peroxidase-like protein n=1 Tax=Leptotrombidium deliense TaxID=299467 RepID=A0A443SEU1_9ACAR|nr:Heme peroxidase-like protein [Leptotrombidium deliense]